jgi:hypothetical protein
MAWLTGSVQGTLFGSWLLCLFSYFPAPLVPRGLNSAQLPPTPWVCPNLPFLFFSRRSSLVIDLCLDCLGSRQPGQTQGVGLGSLPFTDLGVFLVRKVRSSSRSVRPRQSASNWIRIHNTVRNTGKQNLTQLMVGRCERGMLFPVELSSQLYFCGSYLPSWIRIQTGSISETLIQTVRI